MVAIVQRAKIRPGSQLWDDACGDHTGLARTGRPDQRDQPLPAPDRSDHILHQRTATEEVADVLLTERPKALVGIPAGQWVGGDRRLWHERRIVDKHPFLEAHEGGRRVQAELVGEQVAHALVRAQRLRVPARAIQREHQELARALSQRVLADGRLERWHHLRRATGTEIDRGELLDGA